MICKPCALAGDFASGRFVVLDNEGVQPLIRYRDTAAPDPLTAVRYARPQDVGHEHCIDPGQPAAPGCYGRTRCDCQHRTDGGGRS